MMKSHRLGLHIFRRDLRLQDNTALIAALEACEHVIPCFIFDPRQLKNNAYAGDATLSFMANSLASLDAELKAKGSRLYLFYGEAHHVVDKLLNTLPIDLISLNQDYTPFSLKRDTAIETLTAQHKHTLLNPHDALLHAPGTILKSDGTPYTVFTPFFRRASQLTVKPPKRNTHENYYQQDISSTDTHTLAALLKKYRPAFLLKGGREEAKLLLKACANLDDYKTQRNIPAIKGTSTLSAHHKFGTLSIRETHAFIQKLLGPGHTLITELYWRDFFTHVGYHFPHVYEHAFHRKYDKLSWVDDPAAFQAWCSGNTGFPIVDAGMRELNTTGYMHNRVRMITASFLCKDLQLNWRLGEQYFATQLLDYDPAVNNGNWQWSASTGCDAQPYFRIFNPWRQQVTFDPECLYIKKWIPELARFSPKHIHALGETMLNNSNYPQPIVNHAIASKETLVRYRLI